MLLRHLGPRFIYPYAERYVGRNIQAKRLEIARVRGLSIEERQALARRDLVTLLEYAKIKVPYYRDLFEKIHFVPGDISKDLAYLCELPFLTKDIIRSQGDRLVSDDHRDNKWLHKRSTGGSTGEAVVIQYSQEDLDWTAAVNLSLDDFTMRPASGLEVHLAARFEEPVTLINRCYGLVKNLAMNRANVFVHDVDDNSLEQIYRRLRSLRPYLVQGHPSTLYALSLWTEKRIKKNRKLFEAFESTGETLDLKQADHISQHLGCKIFNRYGSAEFGVVAHSRRDPFKLEIIESLAHVESIADPDTDDSSELVITGLKNFAMPLIRYRTGDQGKVEVEVGARPEITQLRGRIHDIVKVTGRSFATHFIQDVIDRAGEHREFQIHFDPKTREVERILVVPKDDFNIKKLEAEIFKSFSARIELKLIEMHELRKVGSRDKFRRALPTPIAESLL
ncbi:MAG: phenylacetate--CoA ligase family protein [Proteobacteria bacterium]|nr:MAG: phenylacetate--CoA ligase family protein [Pseudomonadota bacterium]